MPTFPKSDLVALRLKTNLSQASLSQGLGINRRSVIRWENTGCISERHLSQLLTFIPSHLFTSPAALGRPAKPWRCIRPNKKGIWPPTRYFLWMPGNADHGAAILEPPPLPDSSWTERIMGDANARVRYAIDASGEHYQIEIIDDYKAAFLASGGKIK